MGQRDEAAETPAMRMTLSEMLNGITSWVLRLNQRLPLYWIQAEFSDLQVKGGHCYVELVEKNEAGATVAKMRANIWRGTLGILQRKFEQATGRQMQTGMKVLVRGSVTHHSVYGMSFVIDDIDPSYTLGDIERIRREILARLSHEGIIDSNKRLPIGYPPQRLAVISSDSAAGYGDFINQLNNNPDGFVVYTRLFPAVMQGERTAASVMAALSEVERTLDFWDAVVLIRGGGATTDLNGFDNLDLARRVATFPLPVIVGIGHERDRTVLDEIACVRCKTPTAAAAYIIDSMRMAYSKAVELVTRIARYGSDSLRGEHLRLTGLMQAVPATARRRITQEGGAIERMALKTSNAASGALTRERMRLQRFDDMLRLLSPDNTLRRGYSITRVNGRAVCDPAAVPPGATVVTTLAGGEIRSTAN